ncbi:histidine kinase [Actinoplanes sp. SE50]|nr:MULTISPECIES: ATP-binding protein [unclassified Actinoplanes]AEV84343.1 sensory box histidine kinase PhoR [Actinoplanes sp. SE50/110]ATO82735.1 histidine kinase [Actinoplanes sp. SE50]SLM00142.1 multi-sensor signal transduction histidine kinase [Actinoplanes sp. SE50/110]
MELTRGQMTQTAADRMAAVTARAAQARCAMIHITDGQNLRLIGGQAIPAGFDNRKPVPVTSTLAGLVLHTGFPVTINDIHTDIRVPLDAPVRSTRLRCYAGFPVRDPDGHIVGVCAVADELARDWLPEQLAGADEGAQACTALVAEHLARESELRQRVFLDTLLDSLDTGVAACDADGRLVLVNRSLRERLELTDVDGTAEEWVARLPATDTTGTPLSPDRTSLLRALRGETVRGAENFLQVQGQRHLFRVNGHPITYGDQQLGAVAVFHDITAARHAERLQQMLSRTKDDYLNLVGHELRTPVAIIDSYLDLLHDSVHDTAPADLVPMIEAARRGSERLRRLITALLDLSALDAGRSPLQMSDIDLSTVVTAAVDHVTERAAKRNITITCHVPPHTPQHADYHRMRQLILALLDNAIAYTPAGGTVTVTLTSTSQADELTVSDTGFGIPAYEQPHVFERFFRGALATELAIPGAGLGLTIARLITERHDGTITVTTNAPQARGTSVHVRLPH